MVPYSTSSEHLHPSGFARTIEVIDSHTGGEPTRVVTGGAPDLGGGTMAERREILGRDHDDFRDAVVNESRGTDEFVGAI